MLVDFSDAQRRLSSLYIGRFNAQVNQLFLMMVLLRMNHRPPASAMV